jgi:hypothetical protein
MSLPKNCLYTNSIESSYARNYNNNIAPQNGLGPYGVGETIIINIPTGRNLVMSGADSLFKFSLTARNDATALLSDIDNYNNLVGMMMALQQSGDSAKGKMNILAGIESLDVTRSPPTAGAAVVGASPLITNAMTTPIISGERLNGYNALPIPAPAAGGNPAVTGITTKRFYTIPIMNFLSYSDK